MTPTNSSSRGIQFRGNELEIGVAAAMRGRPSYEHRLHVIVPFFALRDYVLAARVIGAKDSRILLKHILPNAIFPTLVLASLDVGTYVISFAALSFLGLGEKPPAPSLGSLLLAAKAHLREAWWMAVFPGATLAFLAAVRDGTTASPALAEALPAHRVVGAVYESAASGGAVIAVA